MRSQSIFGLHSPVLLLASATTLLLALLLLPTHTDAFLLPLQRHRSVVLRSTVPPTSPPAVSAASSSSSSSEPSTPEPAGGEGGAGAGAGEEDTGPSGRDFYNANTADDVLLEAQEKYAQARARRERYLMEAQKNFQKMVQRADEELQEMVDLEEQAAQKLEKRALEVKEVKEEVSALVNEADELRAGGKGLFVSFDIVSALSFLVVMDTFYVSYLSYRGSDLLINSLGTEVILGGFLYYKIKEREKEQKEREQNTNKDNTGRR